MYAHQCELKKFKNSYNAVEYNCRWHLITLQPARVLFIRFLLDGFPGLFSYKKHKYQNSKLNLHIIPLLFFFFVQPAPVLLAIRCIWGNYTISLIGRLDGMLKHLAWEHIIWFITKFSSGHPSCRN